MITFPEEALVWFAIGFTLFAALVWLSVALKWLYKDVDSLGSSLSRHRDQIAELYEKLDKETTYVTWANRFGPYPVCSVKEAVRLILEHMDVDISKHDSLAHLITTLPDDDEGEDA